MPTATDEATKRPTRETVGQIRASATPDIKPAATATMTETVEPIAIDEPTKRPTRETVRQIRASVTPEIALTATASPTATVILSETAERIATGTPTKLPIPVVTPEMTASLTPEVLLTATASPTMAPTATETLVASATASPLPFVYSRLIPTPTAIGFVGVAMRSDCVPQIGWRDYQVNEGENLLAIAESVGSTIIEIRDGNCFDPITGVFAGETVLLPALPLAPPATAIPVFVTAADDLTVSGCDTTLVQIVEPGAMQELSGIFALLGSADAPDFAKYLIEVRPGWSDKYFLYLESEEPVRDGVLGVINAEVFGVGLHRLRLSVITQRGAISTELSCDIPTVFATP